MARQPSRGFRLHELELFRGQTQTAVAFEREGFSYADHLEEAIGVHLLGVRLVGKPRLDYFSHDLGPEADDEDEDAATSLFELHDLRRDGRRIWVTYRAGGVGAFRWAVPRSGGAPVDVQDHAVINEQRACFLLPPGEGTVGLLVAESAGRSASEHSLRAWVHAASKAVRGQEPHWRLRTRAVADPDHVRQLINEEAVQEVVLMRKEETADRSTTVEPFTIRAPLKTAYSRRTTVQRLTGWANRDSNDPLSLREGARELAAIIDPRLAEVNFDDGYVKVKGDSDSGQQLRPDLARDVFTYRLGPGMRSEDSVLTEARGVADSILGLSDLELPWP